MSAEGRGQENVGRGWRRSHNQGQLEREEASFQRSKENFTNSKMDKIFDKFKSNLLREKKKVCISFLWKYEPSVPFKAASITGLIKVVIVK